MSTVDEDDGFRPRARGSVLRGYYFLRESLWRSIVLLGLVLTLIGVLLDVFDLHEIFAGMFGVWGLTAIVAGTFGFVVFKLIRLYGRYFTEER